MSTRLEWTAAIGPSGDTEYSAPGLMANCYISGNAINLRLCRHVNGSGETAFGGASDWPHLTVNIAFQVGEERKRREFVILLQKLIEQNI
jgi:hypothetical protein